MDVGLGITIMIHNPVDGENRGVKIVRIRSAAAAAASGVDHALDSVPGSSCVCASVSPSPVYAFFHDLPIMRKQDERQENAGWK